MSDTEKKMVCPFLDPTFTMDLNEPCPVCGDLDTLDILSELRNCVCENEEENNA